MATMFVARSSPALRLWRLTAFRSFSSGSGRLDGKVALVTGGAGGLGRGICERFAREGAKVAVVDMDLARAQAVAEALETKSIGFAGDVSDEQQVQDIVEGIVKELGGVDILVSNAGHQHIAPVHELSYQEWRRMLDVHLGGTFLFTRACLREMYAKKVKGKIIIMGSIHSREASVLKAPYVAAKHGLVGFARTVAKEAGPSGIACNVVCPGFVRTPLVEQQIPQQAKSLGISEEEVIKTVMLSSTVDKEFTTVEDIAEACLFFAAHPTNALTGQTLNVSHGWNMS
eukprot:CAMPEP_0206458930 /NCGR_PEP_ID=MMETSP0324_2-20121206/23869_1 /ASSEMBLY_ACC=CAM_ASM_000836 /TAXON_ID=2866 /ORGANISM="Crypthecodinium cohnii, Strain Seligo" /LENGTH=285 /DNA_ID=CAMNT_0053930375 /DNA_START=42 /DNA_END=899 /DNA_ORIENTATION=-